MNAPVIPEVVSYWEMRAKSAEARLASELRRCGRAEGALEVVQQSLAQARLRVATLQAELDATTGELGDLRDEMDSQHGPTLEPREVYGVGR